MTGLDEEELRVGLRADKRRRLPDGHRQPGGQGGESVRHDLVLGLDTLFSTFLPVLSLEKGKNQTC